MRRDAPHLTPVRPLVYGPLLGVIASLFVSVAAYSQQPRDGQADQLLLQVRRGDEPVREVRANDVTIDGGARTVLDVRPIAGSGPVAVYFDYALSRTGTLQAVADQLAQQAEELVKLGPVEIVVADPNARVLLPSTRDPEHVRNALNRIYLSAEAENAITERRRLFLQERRDSPEEGEELATESLADEVAMLSVQQDELILWAAERGPRPQGGFLLLVNESLGLDPLPFYTEYEAAASGLAALAARRPTTDELASALAGLRLTTVPVGIADSGDDRTLQYRPDEDTPVGFRIRFGGGPREPTTALESVFSPATQSWLSLAAATGSEAVVDPQTVGDMVARLRGRYLLEISQAPAAGEPRVESDLRGVELSASPALAAGTPVEITKARIRRLLADNEPTGAELDVSSSLVLDATSRSGGQGVGLLSADFANADPQDSSPERWRVAVGFHTADETILIREYSLADAVAALGDAEPDEALDETGASDSVSREPLGQTVDERGRYRDLSSARPQFEVALTIPTGTDAAAIIVEDVLGGDWGLSLVDFVDRQVQSAPDRLQERKLQLLPIGPGPHRGRITIGTQASQEVDRVAFYLNGKRVARRRSPPFEVRLDVGSSGRTLQLVAAAYDRAGNEIDRDRMLINEPADSFWIRILSPEPGSRQVGPTDVRTQLKVPDGSRATRVDFYWKERLLSTVDEPPFETSVRIPVDDPDGFLRAEARLSDGRLTEDVVFLNRAGFGEQIGVELVELYIVASDRQGKPVLGLEQEAFTVLEDGRPQEIEEFEVAGDLPLTIGMAMDSSSSLFVKMPAVKKAAGDFVDNLVQDRDRAFLVGFGSQPELVLPTTRRLERLQRSIRSLEPLGATAVWGAIDLSLQQLEGITGRKALVVFYDGDDEDEQRAFERSLSLARRTRTPIYLILMNDAAARSEGRSLSSRAFVGKLERIARAGGGRVFYVRTDEELGPVFDEISQELRSHYLITYYPQEEPGGPLWRPVEVQIEGRGLSARTIEGRGVEW